MMQRASIWKGFIVRSINRGHQNAWGNQGSDRKTNGQGSYVHKAVSKDNLRSIFKKKFFDKSLVALHCCASFCHTTT